MKKLFFLLAASCIANCALAQLDVLDPNGKKMGTAKHTISTTGGKITTTIVLNMNQNGAAVVMTASTVHSAAGDPLSQNFGIKATNQGNTFNVATKATFAGKKATLVSSGMGNSETKTVTAVGAVRDASIVWSTGKVPAVGTKTTYYQLDPTSAVFEKHTATYHGLRKLKIGGKDVSAHVITSTGGGETVKVYFTSKGELLKLESPQFTLVKR